MPNLPAKFEPAKRPQEFIFDGKAAVRIIPDEDKNPWFIALDVCKALDYANTSKAVSDNVDPEDTGYLNNYGVISSVTVGYTPGSTLVINESGLYALVLRSSMPKAKAFKRWVTHDVLPAIRRNGAYNLQKLTPAQMVLQMAQQLVDQERAVAELDQRMLAVETRQTSMEQGAQYFTILAYASMNGIRLDTSAAQVYGSKAAKLSRDQGVHIGKASDPRYGYVGTYHISILDQIFKVGSNDH